MGHGTTRTRWAALGAAVAVTLGAGGITMVGATSPSGATAYVPIEPCRAADTRPGPDNIGPRATPLGAAETHSVSATDGDCSGEVPATATGLQLNVTALNASAPSFLTIWGSGDQPLASSLNPTPGQPPVPNAVTTGITAGSFEIFNQAGTVDVIVDIVGFYTDHDHDDRYYTKAQVDAAVDVKADAADTFTKAEVDTAIAEVDTAVAEVETAVDAKAQFDRTLVVGGSGTDAENGDALRAAIAAAAAAGATSADPWAILIEPGAFDLGNVSLTVPDGVHLRGSGQHATTVSMTSSPEVTEINVPALASTSFTDLTLFQTDVVGSPDFLAFEDGSDVLVRDAAIRGCCFLIEMNGAARAVFDSVEIATRKSANDVDHFQMTPTAEVTLRDVTLLGVESLDGIIVGSGTVTMLNSFVEDSTNAFGGSVNELCRATSTPNGFLTDTCP